ncbi:MAG: hypothetical protein LBQ54_07025 [Planctomycetaceae bacterium]|jgi:hypothetical protein|nr:hypothetical protein [Planctomycetaceae bacterium]
MKNQCISVMLAFGIVMGVSQQIFAQNSTELELYQTLGSRVDKFFRMLDDPKSTPKEAYLSLLGDSPLVKNNQTAQTVVGNLVTRTGELRAVGQVWIPERFDAQMLGKDIVVLRYLYKSDTIPVVWYFTFYHPQSKAGTETTLGSSTAAAWLCISTRFDTNLELLLNNNAERKGF